MTANNRTGVNLAEVIELDQSALVSASEIARDLGVPESHIRRLARQGRIPFYRVGKYMRFDRREVREYMRRETTESVKDQEQYG